MIESTFIEIINKIDKNVVAGCIYNHPKRKMPDYLDNHLLPLLEKLPHKNKQILIMGDFNINLLNYNDKKTSNFLNTMFLHSLNNPFY